MMDVTFTVTYFCDAKTWRVATQRGHYHDVKSIDDIPSAMCGLLISAGKWLNELGVSQRGRRPE